ELAVLDWEGYREGLPFCDLFQFLIQWHGNARALRTEAAKANGLQQLLFAPAADRIGHAIRAAVTGYVRGLQFDGRFVPLLILYTFLELASRRAQQNRREQSPLGERRGNDNLAYIEILAQARRQLFEEFPKGSLLEA